MAGYYDPNIGWVEYTDAQAATLPAPYSPVNPYANANPWEGRQFFDPEANQWFQNPWTNERSNPSKYIQKQDGSYIYGPDLWGMGLTNYDTMQGFSIEPELKRAASQIGLNLTDQQWIDAIGGGMTNFYNTYGHFPNLNSSNANFVYQTLKSLDPTKADAWLAGNQDYYNQSASQAGARNSAYQDYLGKPEGWQQVLMMATPFLAGGAYAALGAGAAGAGAGASDLAGIVSPEVANFGVVNGVNAANLADLGSLGAGLGSFTTTAGGSTPYGVMNASNAMDITDLWGLSDIVSPEVANFGVTNGVNAANLANLGAGTDWWSWIKNGLRVANTITGGKQENDWLGALTTLLGTGYAANQLGGMPSGQDAVNQALALANRPRWTDRSNVNVVAPGYTSLDPTVRALREQTLSRLPGYRDTLSGGYNQYSTALTNLMGTPGRASVGVGVTPSIGDSTGGLWSRLKPSDPAAMAALSGGFGGTPSVANATGAVGGVSSPSAAAASGALYGGLGGAPTQGTGYLGLLSELTSNQNPFVKARVDPLMQQWATARGNLTHSLGRRGVMGSSFGNMDLANLDTMAGRSIGDAGALATQEALNARRATMGDIGTLAGQQMRGTADYIAGLQSFDTTEQGIAAQNLSQELSALGLSQTDISGILAAVTASNRTDLANELAKLGLYGRGASAAGQVLGGMIG